MIQHRDITDAELRKMIKLDAVRYGGNRKLKIYGTLNCASGKRMKRENRVFVTTEAEAVSLGYRPCGNCMADAYKKWKHGSV